MRKEVKMRKRRKKKKVRKRKKNQVRTSLTCNGQDKKIVLF